jgi:hypothetical protein
MEPDKAETFELQVAAEGRLLCGTGSGIIRFLLKPLIGLLNFVPEVHLQSIELPVWGLGIGTMIYLFGKKGNFHWSVWGMLLGIILLLI